MKFTENYQLNYAKEGIVEKKGKFDYISWSHAQKIMREDYPNMKWQLLWNEQTQSLVWNGFVRIVLTNEENGKIDKWDYFYPILNNSNNAVTNPTQKEINNAQNRAFAKIFAMATGHGLNLFTGEDLTQYETVEEIKQEQSTERNELKELRMQFLNHPEINSLDKKTIDATIKAGVATIKKGIAHLDKLQIEKTKKYLGDK